ncbi:MAG TPA: hypothetical protein VMV65_08085 [Alphaproteobacteria bacterium]|nr:hypothetical protein [Alphaproteobacteria bacterium]
MKVRPILATVTLLAMLAVGVPATPAQANGAASTRNLILLGGAAAAYLIIQHNRKVHEQEAQNAQRQAALEDQNDDARSAYEQAEHAYHEELAVNGELQKEIAYQHSVLEAERKELASLSVENGAGPGSVATVSYGWGNV